ncbi:MAG: aminopeptidase P family protein [Pseudomonadota bacterium]
MFQSFENPSSPETGPPRLAALRAAMADADLAAFLVPRADAHMGEYVAPRDERLAWLTGFTGSAGFAAILKTEAGVFIDGRYRLQVRSQVDLDSFTPVDWPATKLGPWLAERLEPGETLGFDPWLHTAAEVERLEAVLDPKEVALTPCENLIDRIWADQPAPPAGRARTHPIEFAGESSTDKRARLAGMLRDEGHDAAIITLPDSICWLLNIRGSDIARNPLLLAFAVLHADGAVTLFVDPAKLSEVTLDDGVTVRPGADFAAGLETLSGKVRVDKNTAPFAVAATLLSAGADVVWGQDPCILPKARKNVAEIAATRAAHLRDAAAMIEFLAWLDDTAPSGGLTEIDVVQSLEAFRRAGNALQDISFDTIAGAGPNGAVVHYRVNEDTNRPVNPGELLLVDSGGQYLDGTTDITRTVPIGAPTDEHRRAFTRVLQGMIAISRARWPRGLAGRDLDALARAPLWMDGRDYDHGTGHGVGVFLNVHEGPQRLARISEVPLEPGMILSNEPGYYREGAFGIRIENLIVVEEAPALPGGDDRDQLCFSTLTWVPIDRRLVAADLMSQAERDWLNAYHAEIPGLVADRLSPGAADWLEKACRPV